jgi:hypothetical protein
MDEIENIKIDAAVREARPRGAENLPFHVVGREELMEEILQQNRATGVRRWVAPLVGVAAVGALVVGTTIALPAHNSDEKNQVASQGENPPPALPTNPKQVKIKPSVAPTVDNLLQVIVNEPGWELDDSAQGKYGGSYQGRLQDIDEEMADSKPITLFGQEGTLGFGEAPLPDNGNKGDSLPQPEGLPPVPQPTQKTKNAGSDNSDQPIPVTAVFPGAGKWMFSINAETADLAIYEKWLSKLQRVDQATWEAAFGKVLVLEKDGQAFLEQVSFQVPVPPGVQVSVEDLDLPQEPYNAQAAYVKTILCGWVAEDEKGNPQAEEALRSSKQWPVLLAMKEEGDYPLAVWGIIDNDLGTPSFRESLEVIGGC